jgi:peptide/nickel transport system permease protein
VIALSIAYLPYIARLVRGEAMRQRNMPYIQALEVQGASGWSICVRHLLPNVRSLIIAQVTLTFGSAMVDIAALSFLGLGVRPPRADWGQMVASGQSGILRGSPQESIYSGALIVLTVIAFTVLGDHLAAHQEGEAR